MAVSFGVVTTIFAGVFKFLPDVRVPWRSVWVGALFTAALFTVGKYLIGLYIAKTGAGSVFGAGGAVIVIMIWIYYSSLLILFGAQYTKVAAEQHHVRIEPARQARFITEKEKVERIEKEGEREKEVMMKNDNTTGEERRP